MIDICSAITTDMGELFTCISIGEYLRVRSPLMYPDGDYIDAFVRTNTQGFVITDLGETARWLRMQTVTLQRSPKQKAFIEEACVTHGVEWFRGSIVARARTIEALPASLMRVIQAAFRISDIWFTMRQRIAETILDDVAMLFTEKQLAYDRNETLLGRSQKEWSIDFHVRNTQRSRLVEVLSTGNRAAGQSRVKHVVAAWHDLSHFKVGPERLGFVTLFDDTTDVWTQGDFNLLGSLSDIAFWSRPDEFLGMLAA